MRLVALIALLFVFSACSASRAPIPSDPNFPEGLFLPEFNIRSGVRYPRQAHSVLNTVAGHMALSRGVIPQAAKYFDEVARSSTDNPVQLVLTRADIALQLGDLHGALAALEQASPADLAAEDRLLRAALLVEVGRFADALSAFRTLLAADASAISGLVADEAQAFLTISLMRLDSASNPACDDPELGPISNLVCGRLYEARGLYTAALDHYRRSQALAPELRSVQLDEYRVMLKLGRGAEVIASLTKTFKTIQSSDLQRLLRASPSTSFSELLAEINRLSPGDLSSVDLRSKLAAQHLRASQPVAALRELSIVLALEPSNDSARYLRASLLAASGRRTEARSDLLFIAPDKAAFGQARLLAAQLARLDGDLELAQADLRPYVDSYPGDKLGVLTYLSLLKEQGKFQEGLDLVAVIDAATAAPQSWLMLERAQLLKHLRRDEEALQAAEQALEFESDDPAAQNFIAYELAIQGRDLDRARELAESAVQAQPEEPFYIDTLGWVMFRRGQLNRAQELLSKALELSDGDIVIAEHLGDVLEAIESGSGQGTYRNALERARDNERSLESDEEREVRQRLEDKVKW